MAKLIECNGFKIVEVDGLPEGQILLTEKLEVKSVKVDGNKLQAEIDLGKWILWKNIGG